MLYYIIFIFKLIFNCSVSIANFESTKFLGKKCTSKSEIFCIIIYIFQKSDKFYNAAERKHQGKVAEYKIDKKVIRDI